MAIDLTGRFPKIQAMFAQSRVPSTKNTIDSSRRPAQQLLRPESQVNQDRSQQSAARRVEVPRPQSFANFDSDVPRGSKIDMIV